MVEKISQSVTDSKASQRILIQSPENGFLKDLRTAQPQWIFGTSQAQVTRLIMLSAIGLQAAAPLKSDVFVMETRISDLTLDRLTKSMIEEIHRRKMKIYAGPGNSASLQQAINRGVDGLLSNKPAELLATMQKN
jgi:glycerophosphoryl diester phosphodiesterase